MAVRLEGAHHQWKKIPPGELWCAFEDGEVKVIGDEPANTD
jgi:hypothetical protein